MSDINFVQIYGLTLVVEILRAKVFSPYKIFESVKKDMLAGSQQGVNPIAMLQQV